MSIDLHDDEKVIVTKFYGGNRRGMSVQITANGKSPYDSGAFNYVQLDRDMAVNVYRALGAYLDAECAASVDLLAGILDAALGTTRGQELAAEDIEANDS